MATIEEEDAFFTWYRNEHTALHKAWTAAVGTFGYDKDRWKRREKWLDEEAREKALKLGISPPYLRDVPRMRGQNMSDIELLEAVDAVFGPKKAKLNIQRRSGDGALIKVEVTMPIVEYGYVTLANLVKLAARLDVQPDNAWLIPVAFETIIRLHWRLT